MPLPLGSFQLAHSTADRQKGLLRPALWQFFALGKSRTSAVQSNFRGKRSKLTSAAMKSPASHAGPGLVGWPHVPRLKISHRLFAACCVAAIIDRGWLLPRGYRPKPRLVLRCLRMTKNAANYCSARVTDPHIIVVLVPMIRTTAFACRNKNKLCVSNLRICHRVFDFDPMFSRDSMRLRHTSAKLQIR